MAVLDILKQQRARMAYWGPILALILLACVEFTPYFTVVSTTTGFDEEVLDSKRTQSYYDEYFSLAVTSEDYFGTEALNDSFDGEVEYKLQYDPTPDDEDKFALSGNEMNESYSTWAGLLLVLIIILIIRFNNPIEVNKFVNNHTINSATMGFIAIMAFLLVVLIPSQIASEYEEFDDSYENYDAGFFGEASEETTIEGQEVESKVDWGPSWGYLFLWVFVIICLVSSISSLSYSFEQVEIEDAPIWFKTVDAPDKVLNIVSNIPRWTIGLTVIVAMAAVFSPWYQIEQDVVTVETNVNDGTTNSSSHDFAWTMSPFYLKFDSESGLNETKEGESDTSYDSYSEHPEIEKIAKVMLALRWPLICLFLITSTLIAYSMSSKTKQLLQGEKQGWNLLLLSAMLVILSLTMSSYSADMLDDVEEDMESLSPTSEVQLSNSVAQNTVFGQSLSHGSDFEFPIMTQQTTMVTWGNSYGAFFAQIAIITCLSAFLLLTLPHLIESLNQGIMVYPEQQTMDLWKVRSAVAGLIGVLLITALGSGIGELLVSSESAAPEGLYRWDYSSESEAVGVSADKTIDKDEVWVIEINTADLLSSNITRVDFQISCSEGSQGAASDNEDQLDWSLEAPEGYTLGEQLFSGTLDCDGFGGDRAMFNSDFTIPNDGSLASSRDDAMSLISWTNMVSGIWTLSLTAQVNDGQLPFSSTDSDLEASYSISVNGLMVDAEKQ